MLELSEYAKTHLTIAGCSIGFLAITFVIVMCFVCIAEKDDV
jgi:hypothetical protein